MNEIYVIQSSECGVARPAAVWTERRAVNIRTLNRQKQIYTPVVNA